ncbi:MAG TPA: MauE/DoxX family redox-associated membrane protein [Acidimicrobiales bacterium]|nr:MauE/DoxX family redox-associated membrane protein [Acidimicrobiales bacterium]
MDTLAAALLGAASLLLLVAGAAKVADPLRTAGALRALGRPVPEPLVRAGAGAEAVLGAAGVVAAGAVVGALVAASYVGFAAFVAAAARSGAPVGSCGCFGEADTPARPAHVAVDLALAASAVVATVVSAPPLLEAPWPAWPVAGALAAGAYVVLTDPHTR